MSTGGHRKITPEFKHGAVRLVQPSGRTVGESADDRGIGKSTLQRWKNQQDETALLSGPREDTQKELQHLRLENKPCARSGIS